MLSEKWKKELRQRFDTRAEIYDAKGFLELLDDFKREGTSFQCAAVCTLNTVRQDRVREALEEMSDTHRFDLVIIDEAHHLRNPETKSHQAGRVLSDTTEAMVLLTATPIHLGNQDLYRLLMLPVFTNSELLILMQRQTYRFPKDHLIFYGESKKTWVLLIREK
jgi:superfamily II DNA or RNA helicase